MIKCVIWYKNGVDGEGTECRGLAAFVLVVRGSYLDFVKTDSKVVFGAHVQTHLFFFPRATVSV